MKRNTKIIIAGIGVATIAGIGVIVLSKNGTLGGSGSINDINYNNTVSKGNVIVWYSRAACEYCHLLQGEIAAIQSIYWLSGIKFLNYDTDVNNAIATQMGIGDLPVLMFYKDGQLIKTIVGYQSRDVLKSEIKTIYGV